MAPAIIISEAAFSLSRVGYESLCRGQLLSGVAEGTWAGGGGEGVNIYPELGEFVKGLLSRLPDAEGPLHTRPFILP